MKVGFIGQGFQHTLTTEAGKVINNALLSGKYNSFDAFSAFVSEAGVNNVSNAIQSFISGGGSVKLYVGVDLHGTSKEGLEALLKKSIPTWIVHTPTTGIVYHPKLYKFKGENDCLIVIGSSNLTGSGLYQNIEVSLCVEYQPGEAQGEQLENNIMSFFEGIINGTLGITQVLDEDLLNTLINNRLVLNEEQNRIIRNAVNNHIPAVKIHDRDKLRGSFKKLKVTRPPKSRKKSVSQENVNIQPGAQSTVQYESILLPSGAMWIESRKMTGGSRNILDLSKKGKRDGVTKFGSVEYFGINKEDYSQEIDITLRYNGKDYIGNHVFYAPGNSNWRIRLNGETPNGDKLTDVFRENGSQGKVFVFEKTGQEGLYNFHILEDDLIPEMERNSSDYAWGGSGQGREYGIIS